MEFRDDLHISVWNPGSDTSLYKRVLPGDFVIGLRSFQSGIGYSSLAGLVSPAYTVLRPVRSDIDAGYFRHFFKSDLFVSRLENVAQGIRQGRTIATEDFYDLGLPLPPPLEQRAIADFLDRETARIDATIVKKAALLQKATERVSSLVFILSTQGLGESRLKETGNPFVPNVPEHWDLVPLRYRWTVVDCKHRNPEFRTEGYPIVGPTDLIPDRLDVSAVRRYVDEADYFDLIEGGRKPQRGDIIYTRNASIGTATYVDTDELFTMGQDQCLITSKDQSQLFLFYYLNHVATQQLEAIKIGATFSRINIDQIKQLTIPVPPVREQRDIAEQWDAVSRQLDALKAKIGKQVELLRERRQALITAAVTGQLDIAA